MPAPYDYSIGQVANPAQSFLQGIQMGDFLRKREEDQAAAIEAKLAAAQRQAFMSQLMAKASAGTIKPADYEQLTMLDPTNYKAWSESIGRMNTAQKEAGFANMSGVYSALAMGTPEGVEVARRDLQTQLQAAENSDPQKAQTIKATLAQLDDPVSRSQLLIQSGVTLNGLDPERFKKLTENVAAQRAAPFAQKKIEAEASEAESAAAKAKSEAQYVEREKVAELKKKAADLGLTQANTNKVLTETRKLSAEAAGAALELEALKRGGGIPPAKAFEQEEKLRKEYRTRTQTYQDLSSTFSNLKASAQIGSGPGDIALITGFMKMLDPGSVVRETEFATARDTAGLYANLQNRLEKAKNGQFLTKEQRQEYIALSQKYFDAAQSKAKQDKNALELVVKNYKLNPENVFGEPSSSPVPAAQQRNVVVSY
ncbi:MAG: hypothetical protein ING25_11945 [Burkholderiales bacterium]|nr:hypothetical protein [Burkholderiales bacterium]